MRDVYVLGGHQTDFARNWLGDGGIFGMMRTSVEGALEDTRIDAADIEVAHVGNFAGELFTGRAELARSRVRRGFTEAECERYFEAGECPVP